MSAKARRRWGQIGLFSLLMLFALYTLAPVAFLIINSFKSQSEIVTSPLALPEKWDFSYLLNALGQIHFPRPL